MQSRGLVVTRLSGRTEIATTNDPLGNPEMGSSSTRTDNSGDFRSTTESGTTSLTAVATTLKHLLRSNKAISSESLDVFLEIFSSVSSIPLLLYPTANFIGRASLFRLSFTNWITSFDTIARSSFSFKQEVAWIGKMRWHQLHQTNDSH